MLANVALLLAAVWLAIPALARMVGLLLYPYAVDGLEGTLLYEARLWRSGAALYQPLERFGFVSAPYPPVSYLALMLFDMIPGPHVFFGGRLVSFLAALAVAALIAIMVRRAGGAWGAGALAAALLLSAPPLQLWGTRIKPDVLALCFTTLGLLFAADTIDQNPHRADSSTTLRDYSRLFAQRRGQQTAFTIARAMALPAVCFALAFFTKQTAVAGALAFGIALLVADWRGTGALRGWLARPLIFALCYLALTLGAWALLDLATGRMYTQHVWWNFARGGWWSPILFWRIVGLLTFWLPLLPIALLSLWVARERRAALLPACYLLMVPISLLGAGEEGAHHNHLLETHTALALCGGIAIGWCVASLPRRLWLALPAAGLLALQLWLAPQPPAWYAGQLAPSDPPDRYLAFLRATPGEVLGDDTGLLFQAGKDLRYNDPSTMGPAARSGLWDQSGLLEDIANQKFTAIMIPTDATTADRSSSGRWTPEMLAAIRQHYRLLYRDTLNTFVPR